jgi:hypothetical protein
MPPLVTLRSMLFTPGAAWDHAARHPLGPLELALRYIVPFSLIAPLASFIGMTFLGSEWSPVFGYHVRNDRIPGAVASTFLLSVISVFAIAAAFCLAAPLARVRPDYRIALNIATLGALPLWASGVALVMPAGILLCLAFALHAISLYSLGAVRLLGVKENESVFFVVFSLVFMAIASFLLGAAASNLGLT